MQPIKLFVFMIFTLTAAQAFAAGGDQPDPKPAASAPKAESAKPKLPPFNSMEFAERLSAAEHDLLVLDNRVRDAENSVHWAKQTNALQPQSFLTENSTYMKTLRDAEAELAKAKTALHERFGEGIEKIRDQMWAARYRAQDIRRYGIGNAGALKIAEQDHEKFTVEFLSRWKGKVPKRVGRIGALGLAAAAAPIAIEAMSGSQAEASELKPADFSAPEAAEAERTSVEISSILDDN